jgi:hypothetical protein
MARHLVELIGTIELVELVELEIRDVDSHLASWLSAWRPRGLGWPG